MASIALPSYVIYAVPVIVIIAVVAIFLFRKKNNVTNNIALIYDLEKKSIISTKHFIVSPDNNRAFFPSEKKQSFVGFFKNRLNPEPEGVYYPFTSSLAVYNAKSGGYFTFYSNYNFHQLPVVSGDPGFLAKLTALEVNVDTRISRLTACWKAVLEYVNSAQPKEKNTKLELLSFILIFIAFLVLAYAVNSLATNVSSLGTLMKGIHAYVANTITP